MDIMAYSPMYQARSLLTKQSYRYYQFSGGKDTYMASYQLMYQLNVFRSR